MSEISIYHIHVCLRIKHPKLDQTKNQAIVPGSVTCFLHCVMTSSTETMLAVTLENMIFWFLFVWKIAVKLEDIQIFGLTDGKH